jgi:hypothetical protein
LSNLRTIRTCGQNEQYIWLDGGLCQVRILGVLGAHVNPISVNRRQRHLSAPKDANITNNAANSAISVIRNSDYQK